MAKQEIYVIDTNILIDYPNIIDDGGDAPAEPTIDLRAAHLVIPAVVIQELSSFKREKTDRGKVARAVLRRLRALTEGHPVSINDACGLRAPIEVGCGQQLLSILPVCDNFKSEGPAVYPPKDDMDGQIIITAIVASTTAEPARCYHSTVNEQVFDNVTLLTNDNGLAIRAREYGVKTSRYGYQYPEPYTGRRNVVVSSDMLSLFMAEGFIELDEWKKNMPNQPNLVANEFIVMTPEENEEHPNACKYDPRYDPYFSNIGRYDSKMRRIVRLQHIRDCEMTPKNVGQAIYAEALMDPNISAVICTGPAGSGKTYMPTIYGYTACQQGNFIGVTVVPCKNNSTIGALPGDLDEKMDPDVQPLKNALRNYILNEDASFRKELDNLKKYGTSKDGGSARTSIKNKLADKVELIWENWFSSIPIDSARGRDFAHELAIYDEFQDQNISQADTLIKRIGREGKMVIAGDVEQIHAPYLDEYNNGLVYASQQLFDIPMVAQVYITEDEVVRHPLVKEIAKRQKKR